MNESPTQTKWLDYCIIRWFLVCNLNPGEPFGGSTVQYFVGSFDGKKFVNESPTQTKWLDWGKDNYATVTWSNAPAGRCITLGWMSNWQYANNVVTGSMQIMFLLHNIVVRIHWRVT